VRRVRRTAILAGGRAAGSARGAYFDQVGEPGAGLWRKGALWGRGRLPAAAGRRTIPLGGRRRRRRDGASLHYHGRRSACRAGRAGRPGLMPDMHAARLLNSGRKGCRRSQPAGRDAGALYPMHDILHSYSKYSFICKYSSICCMKEYLLYEWYFHL
jgi:hypothetical protein